MIVKNKALSFIIGDNMTFYPERVGEYIKCSITGETYYTYVPKALSPLPVIEMEKNFFGP